MMYNYIFDFSKSSDVVRWTMKRRWEWRSAVENPSPELLAAWSLEDQRDAFLLDMYLEEEAAEAEELNVKFTSEVKVK